MNLRWIMTGLCLLLLLTGCVSTPTDKTDPKSSDKQVRKTVSLTDDLDIRSTLLVADNQFNYLLTDPIVLRNRAADVVSHVAIRPVALDLFSEELFRWLLETHASDRYVIHLGDALNIACQAEWQQFKRVMADASDNANGWVMVPGNHDTYLYGVTGGGFDRVPLNNVREQWAKACSPEWPIDDSDIDPGWKMTKDAFIKAYTDTLLEQHGERPADFPIRELSPEFCDDLTEEERSTHICARSQPPAGSSWFEWRAGPDHQDAFLQGMSFVLYENDTTTHRADEEFKSFVVQLVNLGRGKDSGKVYGILLDTVDYPSNPVNLRGAACSHFADGKCGINAGLLGMIGEQQRSIVEDWLASSPKDADYIFFGHHPRASLNDSSRRWIDRKVSEVGLSYISGHTHDGYVIKTDSGLVEINVGSVTDWPVEARTLETTGNHVTSELLRLGANDLGDTPWCDAIFDYTTAADYDYLFYHWATWTTNTAMVAQERSLDGQLVSLKRLFEDTQIETDICPKVDLMTRITCHEMEDPWENEGCRAKKRDLVTTMRQRDRQLAASSPEYERKRRLYGACQAIWASKAEWVFTNHD